MRISFFASLLAFSALVGCARSPVAPAQPEPVTRIMVIPVAPIAKMYTENKSIPLGVLWQSLADRIKSSDFDKRMEAVRKDMGHKLTAALVRELTAQGYDVQALEGVVRPADSPDSIDYSRLPTNDPVLHIYLNEVGMYSARFSLDYVPRVNLSAFLLHPSSGDEIYGEDIRYGADADGSTSGSIPADPRHHWSSFNELYDRPQQVAQSYDVAVDALAAKIAANIREKTTPVPKAAVTVR
jgi:hypothetical protein